MTRSSYIDARGKARLHGIVGIGLAIASFGPPGTPAEAVEATRGAVCRAVPDDQRRLECYDRVFGKPTAAPGEAGVAERFAPPTPAPSAAPPAPPPPTRLFHAKITALRFRKSGAFVATLDNDQEWVQYVAQGKPGIAVGDSVTIWPGWLGQYNLKGPSEWLTKVHPLSDASSD